jgi:hypothetical protein
MEKEYRIHGKVERALKSVLEKVIPVAEGCIERHAVYGERRGDEVWFAYVLTLTDRNGKRLLSDVKELYLPVRLVKDVL